MEPFPDAEARAKVAAALGKPVEELFLSFSPPVAAASIAQVHKAEIAGADGRTRPVAVKVLRPGIRRRFKRDLATFYEAARFVERYDPASRRLRPKAVVDTLARSVAIEMDLRLEAAALSEMAESTAADQGFRVPKVLWDLTARDVLTLEWIDGIKLSDLDGLRAAGHELPAIARRLMQAFLRHALRDGFFHADMHQGNLFVDAAGDIVAVDFGIMGRLGKSERRFLAEILFGFIRRDYRRIAEVHFEAGYVPDRHSIDDFAQALRAIGEPIHGQRAADISMARLLTLLFEVTELFDMQTRPELLLVQKTMVVVEGVARTLDPRLRHVVGLRAGGARLGGALSRPGRPARAGGGRRRRARPAGQRIAAPRRAGGAPLGRVRPDGAGREFVSIPKQSPISAVPRRAPGGGARWPYG